MEPLEIICESCESRMRLSRTLLGKIMGNSGRVTCRECASKIFLDATQGTVRVTKGGRLGSGIEIQEIEDFTNAPPSVDPHLSAFSPEPVPDGRASARSAPPPLPAEAFAPSPRASTPARSGVAPGRHFSRSSKGFEAPVPDFRSTGSLSPQTLSDDDDDGLVPLGREFNSSPFASERDQSYHSLFPQPEVTGELSIAPAVASTDVELGPGGQLINQADKKRRSASPGRSSQWVPWTVAAIALFGLGVSVSLNRNAPVLTETPEPASLSLGQPAAPATLFLEEVHVGASPSVREALEVKSVPPSISEQSAPDASPSQGSSSSPLKAEDAANKSAPVLEAAPQVSPKAPANVGAKSQTSAIDDAETPDATSVGEDVEPPLLAPFSPPAAASAMREATALAGVCRKVGDPTGTAKVVVTFAPSGRVTSAAVTGAPFAGTETGGCIASRFRTARVPAFAGEHVTVTKTVTIQ